MKNLCTVTGALALLLLTSCKKDDAVSPATVADKLVEGVWKPTQSGVDANKNNTLESGELESLDACETDDTYDFKSDKTLLVSDNTQKCDPADPDSYSLSWNLANNDGELILSAPGSPIAITWKILELTDNLMRLSLTDGSDQYIMIYSK